MTGGESSHPIMLTMGGTRSEWGLDDRLHLLVLWACWGQNPHDIHFPFGFLPEANHTKQQLKVLLPLFLEYEGPSSLLVSVTDESMVATTFGCAVPAAALGCGR